MYWRLLSTAPGRTLRANSAKDRSLPLKSEQDFASVILNLPCSEIDTVERIKETALKVMAAGYRIPHEFRERNRSTM